LRTRLEDQIARLAIDDIIAEQCPQSPLDDVAVLVLARVTMERRGKRSRRNGVLDQREAAARLLAPHHEPHAKRPQIDRLAIPRPNHTRPVSGFVPNAGASIRAVSHRHSTAPSRSPASNSDVTLTD